MRHQTKLTAAALATLALVAVALVAPSTALAEPSAADEYDLSLPQAGNPQDPAGTGAAASSAGSEPGAATDRAGTAAEDDQPQATSGPGGDRSTSENAGAGADRDSAAASTGGEATPAGSPVGGDDSGSSSLPLLLGLLAAIAVAGIAATVWRRRRAGDGPRGEAIGAPGVGDPGSAP
jgi:cobalamin biosynthesis Mg chelatase CobN